MPGYQFKKKECSDFDGVSEVSFVCKRCLLSVDNQYDGGDGYCRACKNLVVIYGYMNSFRRLTTYTILFVILVFFFQSSVPALAPFGKYIIYILILGFAPSLVLNMYLIKLHMRGIPEENSINPLLAGYALTKSFTYYDRALQVWNKHYHSLTPELRESVLHNLMIYVIFANVSSPETVFTDWAEASGMDEAELFSPIIEKYSDDVIRAIEPSINFGYVPTMWNLIVDISDQLIEDFINELKKYCDMIINGEDGEFDPYAIKVFKEELFVISESLSKYLRSPEHDSIRQIIESFEPPQIPNSMLGMMKALAIASNEIMVEKQKALKRAQEKEMGLDEEALATHVRKRNFEDI